jgi:hypothetical protein
MLWEKKVSRGAAAEVRRVIIAFVQEKASNIEGFKGRASSWLVIQL